jgi:hypothetical protein
LPVDANLAPTTIATADASPQADPFSFAPLPISRVDANLAPRMIATADASSQAFPFLIAPRTRSPVNLFFRAGNLVWPPASVLISTFESLPTGASPTPAIRPFLKTPSIISNGTIDDGSIGTDDNIADPTFDDGLETQGFIYEEPLESYWKDKN